MRHEHRKSLNFAKAAFGAFFIRVRSGMPKFRRMSSGVSCIADSFFAGFSFTHDECMRPIDLCTCIGFYGTEFPFHTNTHMDAKFE